jgi:Xaa-Pro aminopeptidase
MNAELHTKRQRIIEFLDRERLDAIVLALRANFAWLTGGKLNYVNFAGDIGVASLLVTKDAIRCITNAIEAPRMVDEEVGPLGIEVLAYPWTDLDAAQALYAKSTSGMCIAADTLAPGLPAGTPSLPPTFRELRWSLTDPEIDRYRALGHDAAKAFSQVADAVEPGQSEVQVAAAITSALLQREVRTHVCLVAADDRIAKYRHPIPTAKPVDKMVMLVAGAERAGLMCSLTRLVHFGPITDNLANRHRAVCAVDAAMIDATRTGTPFSEIWNTLDAAYAKNGFPGEWRHHHQGGSTGYLGREVKATPDNPVTVRRHQAFAWNPSIAGTKSEDTLLASDRRPEILTVDPTWPTLTIRAGGTSYERPDLLVR